MLHYISFGSATTVLRKATGAPLQNTVAEIFFEFLKFKVDIQIHIT